MKCMPGGSTSSGGYANGSTKFKITEQGILPSLNSLQGLGTAAATNIVKARKNGSFLSIDDLKIRSGISKSVIEILETHGCLEGMEQSNQVSFL